MARVILISRIVGKVEVEGTEKSEGRADGDGSYAPGSVAGRGGVAHETTILKEAHSYF